MPENFCYNVYISNIDMPYKFVNNWRNRFRDTTSGRWQSVTSSTVFQCKMLTKTVYDVENSLGNRARIITVSSCCLYLRYIKRFCWHSTGGCEEQRKCVWGKHHNVKMGGIPPRTCGREVQSSQGFLTPTTASKQRLPAGYSRVGRNNLTRHNSSLLCPIFAKNSLTKYSAK